MTKGHEGDLESLGLESGKKPTAHGSGIYHAPHTPHSHSSEYSKSAGSMMNPQQHKFPANKYHGGKATAKRKGNKGL